MALRLETYSFAPSSAPSFCNSGAQNLSMVILHKIAPYLGERERESERERERERESLRDEGGRRCHFLRVDSFVRPAIQ